MARVPNALVLFAGGGGSTLGLEQAGFATFSVDNEEHCVDQLTAHGWASECLDLSNIASREYLSSAGAAFDLLWMSPPCQKFSRANPSGRGVDGFPWGLSMVRRTQPRTVVVENVQGAPWAEWRDELMEAGYSTWWVELNAADYGVPQLRKRTFLIGLRGYVPTVQVKPKPTHSPLPSVEGIQKWATLGEALPWLRNPPLDRMPPPIRRLNLGGRPGGDRPEFLDRPAPTVTCQEVRGTRASEASGWKYHGGPDRLSDALFSACRVRRASVEDCSIIQGFPPGWKWVGTKTQQYRMVGNAVCPPVAKAIGLRLLEIGRWHLAGDLERP